MHDAIGKREKTTTDGRGKENTQAKGSAGIIALGSSVWSRGELPNTVPRGSESQSEPGEITEPPFNCCKLANTRNAAKNEGIKFKRIRVMTQ